MQDILAKNILSITEFLTMTRAPVISRSDLKDCAVRVISFLQETAKDLGAEKEYRLFYYEDAGDGDKTEASLLSVGKPVSTQVLPPIAGRFEIDDIHSLGDLEATMCGVVNLFSAILETNKYHLQFRCYSKDWEFFPRRLS